MDPVTAIGLVGTIVGLYSNCRDCYIFFTDVKHAERNALTQSRLLGVQESMLKAWGQYWEINRHDQAIAGAATDGKEPEQRHHKLKQYLARNTFKAHGISNALLCIAEALSDREKLRDRYGMDVNIKAPNQEGRVFSTSDDSILEEAAPIASGPREQDMALWHQAASIGEWQETSKRVRSRMSFFSRCRWALKDKEKVRTLIADLTQYNDSLYSLCPDGAYETMQLHLVVDYLVHHNPWELRTLSQSSSIKNTERINHTQGTLGPSPTQQAMDVLIDAADLKLSVQMAQNSTKALSSQEEATLLQIKPNDLKRGESHMAVWRSRKQTVYVEVIEYVKGEISIRGNILKLGRLLQTPACSKRLHTMELLGMVEYPDLNQLGYVYKLPDDLGKSRKGIPIDDMFVRRPRALFLSRDGDPRPSLGWRFDLARKLARSVVFLHACGWLHKNIRSEVVMFFPKSHPTTINRSSEGMDYENPFILGNQYSRPDDVHLAPSTASRFKHQEERPGSSTRQAGHHVAPSDGIRDISDPLNLLPKPPIERPRSPRRGPPSSQDDASDDEDRRTFPLQKGKNRVTISERIEVIKDGEEPSNNYYRDSRRGQSQTIDFIGKLDLRHHPAKRADRTRAYCHAFDIYSLGILLLEIGAWSPIDDLVEDWPYEEDAYEARRQIVEQFGPLLRWSCGDTYANVTMECISIDPEDSEIDLDKQRQLCMNVAAGLAQCRA